MECRFVGFGLGRHRLFEAKPNFRCSSPFGAGDEDGGAPHDFDFCKIYPHIALSQLHLAEGDAAAGLQSAERALNLAERVTARLEIGAAHRALGQPTRPRAIANRQTGSSVEVLMFFRQSSPGQNSPRACLPLVDLNSRLKEIKPRDCYTARLSFSKR